MHDRARIRVRTGLFYYGAGVAMQARQITRAGISVALLSVAAWCTLPLGPVPFTLQTMVLALLPAALDRATACASVAAYLLLGAVGMPVFSGFGAGIAVLAGPTGGYLWGFLVGVLVACTVVKLLERRLSRFTAVLVGDAAMFAIAYACGTLQLMAVASLEMAPALMAAVVPFILPDIVKLVVGARVGCAVSQATRHDAA